MEIITAWIDRWLIPIWILFFIVILGYLIGRIKVKGISLGLSGVLIISLFVGVLLDRFPIISVSGQIVFQVSEWESAMKLLSPFGSALFLSSVGICSGREFAAAGRKHLFQYFTIGSVAVAANFILARVLLILDDKLEEPLLYGIFCGAMTSTPGLSAICEISSQFATQATVGYGSSYLFGVLGVVLFIQFFTEKKNEDSFQAHPSEETSGASCAFYGLLPIAFTVLGGILLGSIFFPGTKVSLGTSGGILIFGLIVGYFIQKRRSQNMLPSNYGDLYRNLGLILFFVGNGVMSGMQLRQNFIPYVVVYGILLTIFPILFTYFVCRYCLKQDKRISLSILCGSMTSTPAFGVLSKSGRTSADFSAYTSSYTGALITMVILLNFFASKP